MVAEADAAARCWADGDTPRDACPRWDGDATLEEMAAAPPSPLMWAATAFLLARAAAWAARHRERLKRYPRRARQLAAACARGARRAVTRGGGE